MITMTTPLNLNAVRRIRVRGILPDPDQDSVRVFLEAFLGTSGQVRYGSYTLTLRNGSGSPETSSDRLVTASAPSLVTDGISVQSGVNISSAYNQVVSAFFTAANRAAGLLAVETALINMGAIHADLAGTVA